MGTSFVTAKGADGTEELFVLILLLCSLVPCSVQVSIQYLHRTAWGAGRSRTRRKHVVPATTGWSKPRKWCNKLRILTTATPENVAPKSPFVFFTNGRGYQGFDPTIFENHQKPY